MLYQLSSETAGATRREKRGDKEFLVVPVVALVEGVIHASNASEQEFVPRAEIQRRARSFNGRPIFLGHPMVDGAPVSGNHPDVLPTSIGTVHNARTDKAGRLLCEAWIDPSKVTSAELARMEALESEVSVGVFVEGEPRIGEHQGKSYKVAWKNMESDHLAILPMEQTGACSRKMGCGLRAAAFAMKETCPTCKGSKLNPERAMSDPEGQKPCKACGGTGYRAAWSPDQARDEKGMFSSASGHVEAGNMHTDAATQHEMAAQAHLAARSMAEKQMAGKLTDVAMKASEAAHEATSQTDSLLGQSRADRALDHAGTAQNFRQRGDTHSAYQYHARASAAHTDAARVHAKRAGAPVMTGY